MANSQGSDIRHEYATVDTKPAAAGYGTKVLSIGRKKGPVYFSIRESEADSSGASDTSNIVVRLQFHCPGDAGWQDYKLTGGQSLEAGHRIAINDMARDVTWRAWVNDNDYVNGKVTFGFDW